MSMALILIQGGIFPYALDRIKTFKGMPHFYQQKPEAHDFKAFFSKRMGISFEKDEAEEAVVIRVYHPRAQYMRTKPWHPSQVTVGDDTPQYMDFKFNIIINKEFVPIQTQGVALGWHWFAPLVLQSHRALGVHNRL